MYRQVLLSVIFLVLSLNASAAVTILKAAGYIDVVKGILIKPATIVVDGNKIVAINPNVVPKGEVRDLGDNILLPGLMDMHTHLTINVAPGRQLKGVVETPAAAAIRGLINAEKTLLAGFTTVRNLGAADFADIELARFSARGEIAAPRIVASAHTITTTGGHADNGGYAPSVVAQKDYRGGVGDGPDALRRAIRYQIKHGAKVIKFTATAGVLSFEGPVGAQQFSTAEMQAIVDEATLHGLKVAAHAHGSEGILAAVKAGVASIEHGSILTKEIVKEMKRKGTYLVPTLYIADSFDFSVLPMVIQNKANYVVPLMQQSFKFAVKEHVKIAFGTDAGVIAHGQNAGEFRAMVSRGMNSADAIRAATVNAADLLGVSDRGELKVGLLADIIAVSGNPLEDVDVLRDVQFVMKDGRIYK